MVMWCNGNTRKTSIAHFVAHQPPVIDYLHYQDVDRGSNPGITTKFRQPSDIGLSI